MVMESRLLSTLSVLIGCFATVRDSQITATTRTSQLTGIDEYVHRIEKHTKLNATDFSHHVSERMR